MPADSPRRSSAPPGRRLRPGTRGKDGVPRSVARGCGAGESDDNLGEAATSRWRGREALPAWCWPSSCPLPRHDRRAAQEQPPATPIGRRTTTSRWRLPIWRRLTRPAYSGGPRISASESYSPGELIVVEISAPRRAGSSRGRASLFGLFKRSSTPQRRHAVGHDGQRAQHRQREAPRSPPGCTPSCRRSGSYVVLAWLLTYEFHAWKNRRETPSLGALRYHVRAQRPRLKNWLRLADRWELRFR